MDAIEGFKDPLIKTQLLAIFEAVSREQKLILEILRQEPEIEWLEPDAIEFAQRRAKLEGKREYEAMKEHGHEAPHEDTEHEDNYAEVNEIQQEEDEDKQSGVEDLTDTDAYKIAFVLEEHHETASLVMNHMKGGG